MQTTLIDPFELVHTLPPARPPMATLSIDVDFEELVISSSPLDPDPDSSSRIRCWCSED